MQRAYSTDSSLHGHSVPSPYYSQQHGAFDAVAGLSVASSHASPITSLSSAAALDDLNDISLDFPDNTAGDTYNYNIGSMASSNESGYHAILRSASDHGIYRSASDEFSYSFV